MAESKIELTESAQGGGLHAVQRVNAPLEQVFQFFSDAYNLEALTPPLLNFKVDWMDTAVIQEGTQIGYRLKIRGIPIRWISRIMDWNPPHGFRDLQVKGPYALWDHQHLFDYRDGATWVEDIVRYRMPGHAFTRGIIGPFIRRDLRRIFAYRQTVIDQQFREEGNGSIDH